MKFEAYAETCIPTKWTILGLTLKPLSLGHYILMKRLGCRYASDEDGVKIDISDLILGTLICSMSYSEFVEFMDDKDFEKEVRKWGKTFTKQVKKDKHFNIFEKFVLFKDYITDGTRMPLFWEGENSSGKPSGSHWSLNIHNVLIGELGFSNEEALNMPLTQVFAHYLRYLESQGAVEIMKDFEEDMVTKGTKCQN